jgi:hypothetical protein
MLMSPFVFARPWSHSTRTPKSSTCCGISSTPATRFKDYGITVADDMMLINTSLNKYDALATVHTRKGTEKFLEVTVWADPTGAMFYQMNPASASNLIEAASKEEKPTQCSGSTC